MTDEVENPTVGGPVLPAAGRRPPESPDGAQRGPAESLRVGPADDPDRYELLGEGLSGGEGVTWRAHYVGGLNAPLTVAVKWLRPPPGAAGDWPTPVDRRRWQDQVVLLGHLQAERLVRVRGMFAGAPPHRPGAAAEQVDCAYLEMEWVDGPTLAQLVAHTPATPATLRGRMTHVAEVGEALASLLSLSRSAGNPSLHRDVKPGNCIVHPERGAVLIDISNLRLVDSGFDQVAMYTPAYTAPEVLLAPHRPREAASDVYSLGALAAFCLLGESPPSADTPGRPEHLAARLHAAAVTARARHPQALADLVMRALDGDPQRRPADVVTWGRELLEMTGDPTAEPPAAPVLAATAAPAAAATAAAAGVPPALLPAAPAADRSTDPATDPAGGSVGTRRRPHRRQRFGGALFGLGVALGAAAAAAAVLALGPRLRATAADDPLPSRTGPAVAVAAGGTQTPAAPSASTPATAGPTGVPTPSSAPARTTGPASVPAPPPAATGTPSRPPVVKSSSTPPKPAGRASGRITGPGENASVRLCSPMAGTATLPAGKTLLLAMKNLENGDPHKYVTLVFGFDSPQPTWSWRGVQYFGSTDASAGQDFQVELMAVDLAKAKAAVSQVQQDALVSGGAVLHTLHVTRIPGGSPDDCPTG